MKQDSLVSLPAIYLGFLLLAGCAGSSHRPQTVGRTDMAAYPDLTIVRSEHSDRGVVLTISDDIFVDELELKASAQRDLAALAGYLKQHPRQKLSIEGAVASPGMPAELARRRGATIEAFFLRNGLDPERLEVSASRDRRPVAASPMAGGSARSLRAPASARSTR